jgi:hypothetical protein
MTAQILKGSAWRNFQERQEIYIILRHQTFQFIEVDCALKSDFTNVGLYRQNHMFQRCGYIDFSFDCEKSVTEKKPT